MNDRKVRIDTRAIADAVRRQEELVMAMFHPVAEQIFAELVKRHPGWDYEALEGEMLRHLTACASGTRSVSAETRAACRGALNLPPVQEPPPPVVISVARGRGVTGVTGERADAPRAVVVPSVSTCGRFR